MTIQPKAVFDIINKVRENPNIALNEIKDQLKRFESNSVYRNKKDIKIRTLSGKAGWQQAVLSIQRQKSKGGLNWNSLLSKAVEEYKQVAMEDDSVNPFQVIKSICSYQGNISFNINESDTDQDLIELMAAMVVGDGDQKKGSRTAIFHPLYKQFACSVRKSGNKNIIYTVFAQNVSQPTNQGSSSPQKKQQSKAQSQSRSNWQDMPTGKFQEQPKNQPSSVASKYKENQSAIDNKQAYIKRGKQLIAELNKIRKQPKQYVHALKAQIQKFKDDKTINTDYGVITTKEGSGPYHDLISELESQYPLPSMKEVTGLTVVAVQQILETQSMIQNKLPVEDILDKFCSASEGVRSIKLKEIEGMPIAAMLMRLLVGDGDRKRTARRKMLSPICKAIGCAISKDVLVVNVGETAKDNPATIQQYMQNVQNPTKNSSKKGGSKKQQQNYSKYSEESDKISFLSGRGEGDRVVIKKSSKSHNESKAGRIYRITETQIIYNDGQIERFIDEQLLK